MSTVDTLSIANNLENAGFTQAQADALATAVGQAASAPDISNLATKDDLRNLLTKDELRSGLAELKCDLQRWTVGLVMTALILNATMLASAVPGIVTLLAR